MGSLLLSAMKGERAIGRNRVHECPTYKAPLRRSAGEFYFIARIWYKIQVPWECEWQIGAYEMKKPFVIFHYKPALDRVISSF